TSHSTGSPFMFETMLRSGVPPHIGQSPPPPGSDAASRASRPPDVDRMSAAPIAARARTERRREESIVITFLGTTQILPPSVRADLQVIPVRAELGVSNKPRRAVAVSDGIQLIDHPRGWLGLSRRPDLGLSPDFAVGLILDAQLQVIPGVGFPRVLQLDRSL